MTNGMKQGILVTRHWSLVIRHSSFVIRHSSFRYDLTQPLHYFLYLVRGRAAAQAEPNGTETHARFQTHRAQYGRHGMRAGMAGGARRGGNLFQLVENLLPEVSGKAHVECIGQPERGMTIEHNAGPERFLKPLPEEV